MAMYYRYRSGVDTFSVPVPVPSVSVAELKRLIMSTTRHGHARSRGRGPREGVALYSDKTGEEYTDEAEMIPRNSTVVVRRRVAGPPVETIVIASSPKAAPAQSGGSSSDSGEASSAPSKGGKDDEDKAISTVIDATELKSEYPSRGGYPYGHRIAHDGRAPPAGYVCHRCRIAGHFIQYCPTNEGDPYSSTLTVAGVGEP
ncbi:hypothetical protein ABZP36_020271 [Zizania latifolia]